MWCSSKATAFNEPIKHEQDLFVTGDSLSPRRNGSDRSSTTDSSEEDSADEIRRKDKGGRKSLSLKERRQPLRIFKERSEQERLDRRSTVSSASLSARAKTTDDAPTVPPLTAFFQKKSADDLSPTKGSFTAPVSFFFSPILRSHEKLVFFPYLSEFATDTAS